MRYRVKKVEYMNRNGEMVSIFYPQHKHWWSWWHYFGNLSEWEDYDMFDTLEEAIDFIRKEKERKRDRVKYIYLDDECRVVQG